MPIIVNLDVMLAKRKRRLNELAEAVGVTAQNLSILKTGKARAVRFSTLEAICEFLECQPGDVLEFRQGAEKPKEKAATAPAEPVKVIEPKAVAPEPAKVMEPKVVAAATPSPAKVIEPKVATATPFGVKEIAETAGKAAVETIDDDVWKSLTRTPWKR
jgi:putative transcriptional regulator